MQRNWRKTEVAHGVYVQPVVPGVYTLRFSCKYLCEMLTQIAIINSIIEIVFILYYIMIYKSDYVWNRF